MNKARQISIFLILEFLGSSVGWAMLYLYRKVEIEQLDFGIHQLVQDERMWDGLLVVATFWIILYYMSGHYYRIYRKSRIMTLIQTMAQHTIGVLCIFFLLFLDDKISSPTQFYYLFLVYFGIQTVIIYLLRFIVISITNKKIHNKKIGYPTLLVGSDESTLEIYEKFERLKKSSGNLFYGFITLDENSPIDQTLAAALPHLGTLPDLNTLVDAQGIQEIIISSLDLDKKKSVEISRHLRSQDVEVRVNPSMFEIATGSVSLSSLFTEPLINIQFSRMPIWQRIIKRCFDILFSLLALLLSSPLLLISAMLVKISSPGPIFYTQTRLGKHLKPFRMIKFRSMHMNAEQNGPQLSSEEDPRITRWGKVMRKYRIDEFPQFFNVLFGHMSIVGPRPERRYYVEQILPLAPYYNQVFRVKPGITSWGMVKFGYAESIEEMIERMKYDLIYIENLSLLNDFKVLAYTVVVVLQGRGK